ncbi:uncharacterized protein B0T15DRAFT_508207 [Chaetomium strumarium]|uniref:Uncharacterized protein n=1 Tax=Chaetomium strumarium TaxID=1170767 RepID=A0AAJ0H4L4_9PEZI|nr:hypothetical protein B0T15DRAFT_508207 [Chaetomium strumarium]
MATTVLTDEGHFAGLGTDDRGCVFEMDCPIIVHTLVGADTDIVRYPVREFLETALPDSGFKLRWLHIPVNNMDWVENSQNEGSARVPGTVPTISDAATEGLPASIAVDPAAELDLEPAETQSNGPEVGGPQQPSLSLYLPYMNWDAFGDYQALRGWYDSEWPTPRDIPITKRQRMEEYLAQTYLKAAKPLHPRRTLDQFYYSSLRNTDARDADQTISKWTGAGLNADGRLSAADDSLLIMVDQLWCWVLDDKTVLTCFPSGDLQYHSQGFTDFYTSVGESWSFCETVWDLHCLFVKEAVSFLFRQDNRQFTDLIETYRWVVGTKDAAQTAYFEEYSRSHAAGHSGSTALDDRQELKLVLEVTDVIDELKMIRHLVQKQREVLNSLVIALRRLNAADEKDPGPQESVQIRHNTFTNRDHGRMFVNISHARHEGLAENAESIKLLARGIKGASQETVVSADETLVRLLAELDAMRNDADYTHKMASLAEARSTSQQGRVIMLFTIVTIIFLPLSFFTSYFGQNASEITGDEKNPTSKDLWQVGAPISIVIIISALLVAYFINKPERLRCLSKLRPGRRIARAASYV